MAEQRITRRDHEKSFTKPTTELHLFKLSPFRGFLLELTDVHFHHDSAVLLPDHDLAFSGTRCIVNYASGLAVLRAALLHSKAHPAQKLLIAGHADTSGSAEYNLPLSKKRADALLHALVGNRDEWVAISNGQHKVEDYQHIFKWIFLLWGWPCDPGDVDNIKGSKTNQAISAFQTAYNAEFGASIGVDTTVGPQTWGAIFDVYMAVLKDTLHADDAALAALRSTIVFVDAAKPTVGCGEHHPVDAPRRSNYKSEINRRVELLFFDPGEEPVLLCHPTPTTCTHTICELYNVRMYQFQPLPMDPLPPYPTFRVTLQYGPVDALFPPMAAQTHTDLGVRARLQAIGYLYEPLNGPNIGPIAQAAWDHFLVVNNLTAATSEGALRAMVENTILDQNTLPSPGQFKKLRVPGTYCLTPADFAAGSSGPAGSSGAISFRYLLETRVWTDNPALGCVPVEAKVEMRRNGQYSNAGAGIKVNFQLIAPDAVPAGDAPPALRATSTTSTSTNMHPPPATVTFTMTGSPNAYVTAEKARNPGAAADPQALNAHRSAGGKRGNTAAGGNNRINVWETTNHHPEFHDSALALRVGTPGRHTDAVMVETNDRGVADGILMPSWIGGDAYKVRAFLDPICSMASDGTESFAVKAETGTFLVWRIMRFSKYLRWEYAPGDPIAPLFGPLPALDISGVVSDGFRRSWMDTTTEPAAALPQTLTQAQWLAAIRSAKASVQARIGTGNVVLGQAYNIAGLFPENNPTSALMNTLTAAQYDAAIPGFPPRPGGWPSAVSDALYWFNMSILYVAMCEEMVQHFSQNAIGGVTVIQAAMGSTLLVVPGAPPGILASGIAVPRRGCFVFFGTLVYASAPYDAHRNTLHEVGHVLYGVHQYTDTAQPNVVTGPMFDEHDYHDLCIMGYMACAGDFCGRCGLNNAGWNTRAMPANSPGP